MGAIKNLAKDTVVYGASSIIGRFLNWCLVPLYTSVFPADEYGIVTYVYNIVALALLVLIYGMETGFFRFANHDRYKDPMEVYSTTLISLAASSSLFFFATCLIPSHIADALHCPGHPAYIVMMAAVLACDAFTAIPFCYLRYRRRPIRFASLKLIGIALNIGFNLFFILLCPWLMSQAPQWVNWFYDPNFGIGYIFLANLISSAVITLLLIPELRGFPWRFNPALWREMIAYSFPLLILGIAGIMNQTLGTLLLPSLVPDKPQAMAQVGIYGANYKIAIVMVMFIQAFRFAYEPFIFARDKETGSLQKYADAMRFFVIFGLFIFLGVMFYLPILRYFIAPSYFTGLKVVPVLMVAELFFGIFFNLSLWYKLTDKTIWGTWFSLLGLAVTVGLNMTLVPRIGYMGCAWAALGCYGVMMTVSYFVGRRHMAVPYPTRRLIIYFLSAMALYGLSIVITSGHNILDMGLRSLLLLLFAGAAIKLEKIPIPHLIHHS
ncbi:MAG: polysaccharide biosynthesis C-terminal domain-containing protein [Pseudoflavonifractor sp.]|nr:polysaccharide biosynthesis C-terminal domain-containing protein [Alloprevotella sp.]MCM1116194.1 polysaccharide biosynthesis C-terminal domain-containing protein [Pseudoflavonifractor sp.]